MSDQGGPEAEQENREEACKQMVDQHVCLVSPCT